jgi:hypothetical protein
MAITTLEELQGWFDGLTEPERVCRVWVRGKVHSGICGRAAVGMDRMAGPRGLVCDVHKPNTPEWFVRFRPPE